MPMKFYQHEKKETVSKEHGEQKKSAAVFGKRII